MEPPIRKYPRTRHLEGSRLQQGDEDLQAVPFSSIRTRNLVVEEKVDGANSAISFDSSGNLLLQSRGHYLTGGSRERHFNLFKQWAMNLAADLWDILGARYVMYGEWLYAKHTVFYDQLPHYFMEFDVLDVEQNHFLSTPRRHELLAPLAITSVRVLHEGPVNDMKQLASFIGPSAFVSERHIERLREQCTALDLDPDMAARQTDPSTTMEGLYIKVEEQGIVRERLKFIRPTFLQSIQQAEGHWLSRPIIPNCLAEGASLFERIP
jgi:hypothetical protein